MYDWIIANKESLKIFYALAIALICAIIVIKTDRLFRLSFHQGIRYFRNAFLFYTLGFLIRYIPGVVDFEFNFNITNLLFEFFLIMAGFFLFYSLLWKKFDSPDEPKFSSLFNLKIFMFYIMAFVIALLDVLWATHYFLFLSQIILFAFTTFISYFNYRKNSSKGKFLKFYFVAMLLSLFAWILNFFAALTFDWNQILLINVYGLNIIIFLLFLYGVIKFTNK